MEESNAGKPRILVVDDSRLMRVAARKILKETFDIIEADDGESAWDKLQSEERVAVVMSDLSMPNLDGLGLLKKIRESTRPELQHMPVIIVTGAEDDDGSKKTALGAGASDFITKPFESVQLLARAKAQAKQRETQQALQASEASNQQLEQQSQLDQLTRLTNKRGFYQAADEDLSYAIRHRTELALLLVRIEKYKILFLRRGKQAAENVLRQVAEILKSDRRREDTVARLDMDTFALLLPSATPPGGSHVAHTLKQRFEQHTFSHEGETLDVALSFGLSSGDIHHDSTVSTLIEEASQALDSESGHSTAPSHAAHGPHATPPGEPQVAPQSEPARDPSPDPAALITNTAQQLQQMASASPAGDTYRQALRAILPLLEAWSLNEGGRHSALLQQLSAALEAQAPDTGHGATSMTETV